MKKLLTLALLASLTMTSAQASVGIFTLNAPLVLGGLVMSGSGLVLGKAIEEGGTLEGARRPLYIASYVALFAGLVILEDNQTLSFSELSEQDAQKLNLTGAELASFNAEVDQANALLAEAQSELSSLAKPTMEDSQRVWGSLQEAVAPETFSAMQKITSQLVK